ISRVLKKGGTFSFLVNSLNDPEYKDIINGKDKNYTKIEDDFFEMGGLKKRFFTLDFIRKILPRFNIILLDEFGETYKDRAKGVDGLIRFIGEKPKADKKYIYDQGENASALFDGKKNISPAINFIYKESAEFFAKIIRNRLPYNKKYFIADLGCYDGKFLEAVVRLLPEYKFFTYSIDHDKKILANNKITDKKICADLEKIPLSNKSIDLTLLRYVLSWNSLSKQKKILKEILRLTKNFAIIQHAGPDDNRTDEWRRRYNDLFAGKEIKKLYRRGHYFSSPKEVEFLMHNLNARYKKIQSRKVDNFSEVFKEKYDLNNREFIRVQEILGNYDFAVQTSWIIEF
ncbi:MAG: class I SAM-dependent methyltransferase, partial [bacterium]